MTPTGGGLGTLDKGDLPLHLGAALTMLELAPEGDGSAEGDVEIEIDAPGFGLSEGLVGVLTPVLPPAVVDVVASPLVIFEALFEAMASSGQALVIPFLAGAIGFFLPGMRRKAILEVLSEDEPPAQ